MAKKKEVVELSDNYYESANEYNKQMAQEYLDNATELSDETITNYTSAARIWIAYINKFLGNKKFTEIEPIEFKGYLNWLYKLGIYDSNLRVKRSVVSNINEHLILYHGKEENVKTFRNYVTKSIKTPITGKKFDKQPLTIEEYENLCKYLEEKEEWQKLAYLKFTYVAGCRKKESASLLKEVINYTPIEKMAKFKDENGKEVVAPIKKYRTNLIKCKGKKSDAPRRLSFDEDTMFYLKKWIEVRGEDDCPYMFVVGKGANAHKPTITVFNSWCGDFEDFIGRRTNPHSLRSARATNLKLSGKNIEAIQQLLGHKSSETTKIYIVDDNEDGEDELFAVE